MSARMLELFSCASGAGEGYRQAGFDLIGVDIAAQPNYPRPAEFIQADALDVLRDKEFVAGFDAIHASPPCQAYSNLNAYNHKDYPDLIAPVRELILETGLPYVIENVEAAASELRDPMMLCGPMFGLKVYRHRLFETNWPLAAPTHQRHAALCARNGYLPTPERPFMTITGGKHSRAWLEAAKDAMGMPWVRTIREVCEAIPPHFSEYIGLQLMAVATQRRAA